jgi:hypothetical protein
MQVKTGRDAIQPILTLINKTFAQGHKLNFYLTEKE